MSDEDKETIDQIASTAVAIINMTDDENIKEMATWIVGRALEIVDDPDLLAESK